MNDYDNIGTHAKLLAEAERQEQAQRAKARSWPLSDREHDEFLERDRRKMEDRRQARKARADDPARFRTVRPVSVLLKKEANLTPFPCPPANASLTGVNEGPRMAQISARSLLRAAVDLIPAQPTKTQWSAIKEAILSLPDTTFED